MTVVLSIVDGLILIKLCNSVSLVKNTPKGDQPEAIKQLIDGLNDGTKDQVLLGITGSGKTFTIANVIQQAQRPTLVLAHNKTLAAQLLPGIQDVLSRQRRSSILSRTTTITSPRPTFRPPTST